MSLTFSPKMKVIRPTVSEEFADKHTDTQTNKQTGYQYYNIDGESEMNIIQTKEIYCVWKQNFFLCDVCDRKLFWQNYGLTDGNI